MIVDNERIVEVVEVRHKYRNYMVIMVRTLVSDSSFLRADF